MFVRQVVTSHGDAGLRDLVFVGCEDLESRPYHWLRADYVPPSLFLVMKDKGTKTSRIMVEPHLIDGEFCKAWILYFRRSGHPVVTVS